MEYLIIDGYNVIGNWPELKRLSAASMEDARQKLAEIIAEYQAFTGKQIIIVFDAYRSKGRKEIESRLGIEIRYTEHGQTADSLIESLVVQLSPRHEVGVVTSDWSQQQIVMGKGARRWSSREFRLEVRKVAGEISNAAGRTKADSPATDLAARINEKSRQKLENIIGKDRKS